MKIPSTFALALLTLGPLFAPSIGHADPTWTLVWNDEFNATANTPPDATRWTYDLGANGGWGNGELETYTSATANCSQDGAGHLAITAVDTAGSYTSARIKTETLFDQAYGRVEASIQIPWGVGVWPAFWMLGSNINTATWPACGEIDLMENIGQYDAADVIGGHIHGPVDPGGADYNGGDGVGTNYTLPGGANFTAGYHVFAAEWNPTKIVYYVDSVAYQTITAASLPTGGQWVFNHPFFILLNLAVGGTAGSPTGTAFPQRMLVDYVRVYKLTDNGTAPYGGAAAALPGMVQAENYDAYTDVSDPAEPGEGFAYNGLGPVNTAGKYRGGDAVSIETCTDTGGGYDITNTSPGQWQQYSVNATQSGVYTLDARVASDGAGGTFHVDVDGNTVTGELSVPDTGGWQSWGDVSAVGISLSAGSHTVLLVDDSLGAGGQGVCNVNYLSFTLPFSPTASPSITPSKSPSASPSATPSATATESSAATRTQSKTPSPSATLSTSESATQTQTPSPSPSRSASVTALASDTPGAPSTATETPIASASSTPSPTVSERAGAQSSPSASPSSGAGPLASSTLTVGPSSTDTPVPSLSPSTSPSASGTASATQLAAAPTAGATETNALPSPTESGTASGSATATQTPTYTNTPEASASDTCSATGTPNASISVSISPSGSPSPTELFATPTASPSVTRTSTVSAPSSPIGGISTPGATGILRGYPVPNPNPRRLEVYTGGRFDSVQAWIFTSAMVRVAVIAQATGTESWVSLTMPADFAAHAANGPYYYEIIGVRTGTTVQQAGPGKFFILR